MAYSGKFTNSSSDDVFHSHIPNTSNNLFEITPAKSSVHIAKNHQYSDIVVHLIENKTRLRATISRRLMSVGFHTEIYSGTQEFASFAPRDGVILLDDANHVAGLNGMVESLHNASPGMPIVVYCDHPTIDGAVAAMRAHAANYLPLDVEDEVLASTVRQAFAETQTRRSVQKQIARCQALINDLSMREQQVLDLLVEGESNKGMARALCLSPRTVEIHRMKLMSKLGAKTSSQAVKIWCTANLAH